MNLDASFCVHFEHRLRTTRDLFDPANRTLAELIESPDDGPARCVAFVDEGILHSRGRFMQQIDRYAAEHGGTLQFTAPPVRVSGGESIKNNPHKLESILQTIDHARLCRRSYVIVVGGGAVLDAVGLATSLAHRGVRLVRVASTTLSQADSGMGLKNGINAFGRKNYLGTFNPPWAVVNDEALLVSLSPRDWRCGFAEAVKVALLKDAALFDRIAAAADVIGRTEKDGFEQAVSVIRQSARLHFEHITGGSDPFERGSARPLDFGHWAAHKLEQMTDHEMRHGEAVAVGLAVDLTYANRMGWLCDSHHENILHCLEQLGFQFDHLALIDTDVLLDGIDEFREHLGGGLLMPMIREPGDPFDVQQIDLRAMMDAIEYCSDRRRLALPAV